MTLLPWFRGRALVWLVWDATCADTFAPTHLPNTSALSAQNHTRTARASPAMSEESRAECQLRRRRSAGAGEGEGAGGEAGPQPLDLQVGYRVAEGGPDRGTPSPCTVQFVPSTKDNAAASCSLVQFRKKQQSFEIQVEECDEEEIAIDSEEEEEPPAPADRPVTPMPMQDFSGSVTYTEGPQPQDYLKVVAGDTDCLTDVSDAESEGTEGQ